MFMRIVILSFFLILFYFAEYPRCFALLGFASQSEAKRRGDEGESRTLRSSNTQRSEVFERRWVGYSASKNEPSRTSPEIPSSLLRGGSFQMVRNRFLNDSDKSFMKSTHERRWGYGMRMRWHEERRGMTGCGRGLMPTVL